MYRDTKTSALESGLYKMELTEKQISNFYDNA
jgi:hypothetical protein